MFDHGYICWDFESIRQHRLEHLLKLRLGRHLGIFSDSFHLKHEAVARTNSGTPPLLQGLDK